MSNISITNTDPGEGSPLNPGEYVAVYGGVSLLDLFYPVGTYYETSDTDFDPNVSWGGVWVEDTWGRVTVAYQSDVGDFNSVGKIGGTSYNDFGGALHYADGAYGLAPNSGAYFDRQVTGVNGKSGSGEQNYHPFNHLNNLQPYIVVKRWHRTA